MAINIAFIPFSSPAQLSAEAICAQLAEKWPELPKAQKVKAEGEMLSFELGASTLIAMAMGAPIPWSDLEGPCKTSWLWKDAVKDLRDHTDHLVVTVMGPEDALTQATLLTQTCAAILGTCKNAPGVYWGNATLVVPSQLFQEFAVDILPKGPPIHIWVDFRVGKNDDGTCSGFTTGLQALGFMEAETENATESPGELRERFIALAGYLLENGPVIQDGNTVGGSADEKIRVVFSDSKFGHEGKVMRLEYGSK